MAKHRPRQQHLPPRKRRCPTTTTTDSSSSSNCTTHVATAAAATATTATTTTSPMNPPEASTVDHRRRNRLNVLTASLDDIHAYAQQLASRARECNVIRNGFCPPIPLTSTAQDVTTTTDDLHFDSSTKFLYFASLSRALFSLRSGCTRRKEIKEQTEVEESSHLKQQGTRDTHEIRDTRDTRDTSTPLRIFAILRGSGDLFDICIRAARAAKCSVEIHAVCLSTRAAKNILKQQKTATSSTLVSYHVHSIDTLMDDHGRAIQPSQLPDSLRAVLGTGRLLVSDALGAFGGNAMIGELMMAASSLFLQDPSLRPSPSPSPPTTPTTSAGESKVLSSSMVGANIMIPCHWTAMVAPVYMPGAYSMVHLQRQSLDEPLTCDVTNVAKSLTAKKIVWSFSMQQGDDAPNGKISAHLKLKIPPVNSNNTYNNELVSLVMNEHEAQPNEHEEAQQADGLDGRRTPLSQLSVPRTTAPTCVHGLAGTCSYELFDGITLSGGVLPQRAEENMLSQDEECDDSGSLHLDLSSNTSSLRTVFFPLAHPIMLNHSTPTHLDVSIFRTVCGAQDCYYFWDCDEDLVEYDMPVLSRHQLSNSMSSSTEFDPNEENQPLMFHDEDAEDDFDVGSSDSEE